MTYCAAVTVVLCLLVVGMPLWADGAWRYDEIKDKMRNETSHFAVTESLNKAQFRFPYHVGSSLKLFTRRIPRQGQEVFFTVTRGSILCSYGGCSVAVKFDVGKVEIFRGVNTADQRNNAIFIEPASRFITGVKKAKSLAVELSFFQEGTHQFEFDVSGLVWK